MIGHMFIGLLRPVVLHLPVLVVVMRQLLVVMHFVQQIGCSAMLERRQRCKGLQRQTQHQQIYQIASHVMSLGSDVRIMAWRVGSAITAS